MQFRIIGNIDQSSATPILRESQLQKLVTVYIVTGLLFMLLPGTFLGVWNLLSISAQHTVASLPPAWLQAHGHAQLFGWIGTFILGIGFYSLSKMGNLASFPISRGWICFALWTAGVATRWTVTILDRDWRVGLPASALLELAGFLIFFFTVSRHQPAPNGKRPKREAWMMVVIAGTIGFLATLVVNVGVCVSVAINGQTPAVPMVLDQRLLVLPIWAFLVPTVWGFNTRWLPVFLGLRPARVRFLLAAVFSVWATSLAMLAGFAKLSGVFALAAAISAILALRVFETSLQPAKLNGVHSSFPFFVRFAYVWLATAAALSFAAAFYDRQGGIWGASRHALTVGFLATMVFAIGSKVLPAFCGGRVLFSRGLMFASLLLLTSGCTLRVASEILAYEGYASWPWSVLPVSAILELAAVALFALNLGTTFLRPPAHALRHA